ncbi:MAG: SDR family NAD(P)-dependent oxidoreductase [Lentisphaerae bacterium]|nr:SDR family NAD(P)-dependent oxidoreductase [Lentisphaerota bacterium]
MASADGMQPGNGHVEQMVVTLPGTWDPSLAIAASRCGATGLLDLTQVPDSARAILAVQRLCQLAQGRFGVIVEAERPEICQDVCALLPEGAAVVIDHGDRAALDACIARLRPRPAQLGLVVRNPDDAAAAESLGCAFLLAKGHEGGGLVGEHTSYVLLQLLRRRTPLPIFVWGGVGRQGAVACAVGGATGIVLDWQLALTRESPLPPALKRRLARMDGSETAAIKLHEGVWVRVYAQPGFTSRGALDDLATSLRTAPDAPAQLRTALRALLQEPAHEQRPWLVGQEAAFAAAWAPAAQPVAQVLAAVRDYVEDAVPRSVAAAPAIAKGSPMAASQGTDYPVMQGAMTRVSDLASFCAAVEQGGALPMLALALMREKDARALLEATAAAMGTRSWGVGILGFVERDLRLEQLAVIEQIRPPYAVIAGGRPDQSAALEAKGIHTYLHVPSPAMLDAFLKEGARRFIFEGFECGGHVGPRSSFVLWESMVDVLVRAGLPPEDAAKVHVYFAGGIHDAHSAAMACALAQPIIDRGMKFGLEMGTAYLFTHEAVATGAIVPRFQQVALDATHTVLAETGPGHAIRCAPTEFYDDFESERARLKAAGVGNEEIRRRLEEHNMGRLRIASKAIARGNAPGPDGRVAYEQVDAERQRKEGMYMIGQVAAMHTALRSIRQLHEDVCDGGVAYLEQLRDQPVMMPEQPAQNPEEAPAPLDIAIVGMACLLPGADAPAALWDGILRKRNALTEIPADRFDLNRWFDRRPGTRDKIYSRMGGFIADVLFDPVKFGIPPASLRSIEPAQLLALELVDRALRDAGHNGLTERFPQKERTSVILGVGGGMGDLGAQYGMRAILPHFLTHIDESLWNQLPEWTEDSFAGILLNVVAGRVSNKFDLGGVNFTVDAACASSLAAIYLACRELADGTSDMVITGGVDTVQNPFGYMCFSSARALTTGDKPRVFDANADGIVISEGLAAVVLKRRADAERDGDRIYAVMRAVAGGSDGRSKSMTAPRLEGQVRTLNRAYAQARISPATVGLFEAHGTGTALGDRTEAQSVTELLRRHGAAPASCAIGSIKSLIGHTKCTAGVAGLMKAALSLHYRTLSPTINVTQPNPQGGLQDGPLYVNTEPRPWVRGEHPRRAGVSAFGFGGTNFHAVLEEYTGDARALSERPVPRLRTTELFTFATPSQAALLAQVKAAHGRVQKLQEWPAPPALADVALTFHQHHAALAPCRAAVLASSLAELATRLDALHQALTAGQAVAADGVYFSPVPLARTGKVAFLFPGQGSQHPNMLGQLALDFPEVGDALTLADRVLDGRLDRPLSRLISPPPAFSPEARKQAADALTATQVAQPAIGACSLALLRLLEDFGVTAAMYAGHSYGELVALHAARAFDAEALLRLSWARGQAMANLSGNGGGDLGTMLAVKADAAAVSTAIQGLADVWIANCNSPRQTVISGTRPAIATAAARCAGAKLDTAAIPVACAFHSPIVAPAQAAFAQALAEVAFLPPATPVFSNVTADAYPAEAQAIPDTLLRQIVSPVQFAEQVRRMYAAGARVFVEIGPNQVLARLVPNILGTDPHAAIATSVREGDELGVFLQALARLYVEGVNLHLDRLYAGRELRAVNLNAMPLPPASHMLLVNGAYARRATEPVRICKPRATMNALPAVPTPPQPAAAPATPVVTPVLTPMAPPAAAPAPAAQAMNPHVLVEWQHTMQRFLETQQRVMQAYLGGTAGSVAPAEPLRSVRPPEPLPPAAAPPALVAHVSAAPPQVPAAPVPAPAALSAPAPAATAAAAPVPLEKALLALVADRTGYPVEMLNLDAGMEADLGIDSIKRVEILTAFGKTLANAGGDIAERLAHARTLREVLREAEGRAPAAASPAPAASPEPVRAPAPAAAPAAAATVSSDDLLKQLQSLVADRTGYPVEMLNPTLDMEADLGIDSIKRVEILSAFGKKLPPGPADMAERLAGARTLHDVIRVATSPAGAGPTTHSKPAAPAAARKGAAGASGVIRYLPRLQPAALPEGSPSAVPGGVILITRDDRGIAEQVGARLEQRGAKVAMLGAEAQTPAGAAQAVQALRAQHQRIGGLIHLAPLCAAPTFEQLSSSSWQQAIDQEVKGFFHLLRAAAGDLQAKGAWVLAGINLGTDLHDGSLPPSQHPWRGGVIGLIKSVVVEWPDAIAKALHTTEPDAARVADLLLAEVAGPPAEYEIYHQGGQRWVPQPVAVPLGQTAALTLGADDVILVIGGARGITGEVARAVAGRWRPTLVLTGRSPWPGEEPAAVSALATERELKQWLYEEATRQGRKVTPLELEREARRLLMDRDMRATRRDLERAGATVVYYPADACDMAAMAALFATVRQRFGRLDGIICGAGQLEDKLMADKSPESFARILDLKTTAAFVLSQLAQPRSLKFMMLFSSVAGWTGNRGQSDYVAANDILNRLALTLSQKWQKRVVAIDWGPWDKTGMVTDLVRRQFEARGVWMVPALAGSQYAADEIQFGSQADALVIALGQQAG